MPRIVILGPQRFRPSVSEALDDVGCEGPVAVITAGWQERETEVDELADHVDRELIHLKLYRRAEQLLAEDEELARGLRQRQDELKRLQELYRLRLGHALDAARELFRRPGGRFLAEHRRAAVRSLRALDRQHLARVRRHHSAFERKWRTAERPSVVAHRRRLARQLGEAAALAIAGGHVAILLNRLRLFDLAGLTRAELPIVAWSAGAMALTDQVVLFHDSPPQGRGDPEVLEAGIGLCPGIVALPHAGQRLELDDRVRVSLFAQRFAPLRCVRLDAGARLDREDGSWTAGEGTEALQTTGELRQVDPF